MDGCSKADGYVSRIWVVVRIAGNYKNAFPKTGHDIPVTSVKGRRQLRSATTGTLLMPRSRTSTGQRSFAVFGPATWNSLSPSLRTPELSLSTFKRWLKTQFFQHPWTIVRRRCDCLASSAPYTNTQTQLNSSLTSGRLVWMSRLCIKGLRGPRSCDNPLPVKFKMAHFAQIFNI